MFFSSSSFGCCSIEFSQELANCWDKLRIELVNCFRINGNADTSRLRMYAKRSFQQVVSMLRHFCINPGIRVLKNNVFNRVRHRCLRQSITSLSKQS